MDSFNDPSISRIIGMFSAQVAKTTIIENVIAYHAHHDPSPIMAVFPTLEIAESFSKDRLAPMIRDTPALQKRFAEAGSKTSGDTLLHKRFHGGHITLAGANSFNSLASRPIRIVLGDEAAKWKTNEKGSPFRQVSVRVRAFWNSKVAYFSTPTDPNSEFHKVWEESDKRLFEVPCPHCGVYVVFVFDENASSIPTETPIENIAVLRWVEGKVIKSQTGIDIRRADDAWFECLSCNGRIDDVARHTAVQSGRWFATQEFYGTAGFWGWQGISPFSEAIGIANEWLGALGSPVELQSVKNETLGLPWVEKGEAPEAQRLYERAEDYPIGKVPQHALFLTAGVDVQKDRIEASIYGWGRGKESWLIDHIVLDGSPTQTVSVRLENGAVQRSVWDRLTELLNTTFRHDSGTDLSILRLGIDSGYSTNEVYAWVRQQGAGRVLALDPHGRETASIVGQPSPVDVTVGGKKIKRGVKVWPVAVSKYKSELYGWLRMDRPEADMPMPGFCHYPKMELSFFQQLTNEQLVQKTNKHGFRVSEWLKAGPNEALDCRNYARACAAVAGIDRFSEKDWLILEAQLLQNPIDPPPLPTPEPVEKAEKPAQSAGFVSPQQGGWFSNSKKSGGWFQR